MEKKQDFFLKYTRPFRLLSFLFLAITIIGVVGLDQASKVHAEKKLMIWNDESDLTLYQGRRFKLVDFGSVDPNQGTKNSFFLSFNLNYVRNQGAAWGALSSLPDNIRVPFFYGVTIFAVFIIILYLRSTPIGHRLARYALVLILSGAIGNFLDRVRLGYVIDWIDINWKILGWRYFFPNFNIADSAISIGVSLLLFDMLVLESLRKKHSENNQITKTKDPLEQNSSSV